MIEVFYRYRVHPAQVLAFEHAYGATGAWAKLFQPAPGFVRTRLFRHKNEPGIYVTVDVWKEKADYDRFRADRAEAYARLSRELRMLFLEEHLLGYYEGKDEYQASLDTLV